MPENILDSSLGAQGLTPSTPVYELLRAINYPHELRALDARQLRQIEIGRASCRERVYVLV